MYESSLKTTLTVNFLSVLVSENSMQELLLSNMDFILCRKRVAERTRPFRHFEEREKKKKKKVKCSVIEIQTLKLYGAQTILLHPLLSLFSREVTRRFNIPPSESIQ